MLLIDLDGGGEDEDMVVVASRNERIREKEVIDQKGVFDFRLGFMWSIQLIQRRGISANCCLTLQLNMLHPV